MKRKQTNRPYTFLLACFSQTRMGNLNIKSQGLTFVTIAFVAIPLAGASHNGDLAGTTWSVDCTSKELIKVDSDGTAAFEVTSNQIYLRTAIQRVNAASYEVRFVRPEDLGSGGLALNWKVVSTKLPVARLHIIDSDHIGIDWKGFKDDRGKRLIKFPSPDVYDGAEIIMTKCT